jgi:hypothetical protein
MLRDEFGSSRAVLALLRESRRHLDVEEMVATPDSTVPARRGSYKKNKKNKS